MNQHILICVNNEEYLASLERRKFYKVIPGADADVESLDQLRVKQESGEDYLYPKQLFVSVDLPSGTEKSAISTATQAAQVRAAPAGLHRRRLRAPFS